MSETIHVALVGNPNSGKSTIFNYFTGARQHVGNYPGITVERREGKCTKYGKAVQLLDLPGTYSLTAYTAEELVARRELLKQELDVAISVINASALERNLYLVAQLLEMGVPVIIVLNMMDEAKRNGVCIDVEKLSEKIGVPVFPVVAREGKGLDAVMEAIVQKGKNQKRTKPLEISYGSDMNPVLDAMQAIIEENNFLTDRYNTRFTAIKYLEGDTDIIREGGQCNKQISDTLQELRAELHAHLEKTLNTNPETIISDYRYGFINSILKGNTIFSCTIEDKRLNVTEILDYILTHKILGPIIMLFVLYLVYQITFAIGVYPQEWLEAGFDMLSEYIGEVMPEGLLKSLILSGIIGGIGGILSFVPLVFFVFLQIAFLEDSGYMARIAYMMDRIFRIFGLHGYSAMPLILSGGIAGGCAVPGIMATRTLRSPKEKLATILATPYMACGAKLPVFILFVGIFFTQYKAEVLFLLTLSGWIFALLASLIVRKTIIKGDAAPFIMELPPYRWPTVFGMCIHAFERIWEYIKKAGTFILAASIVLWAMLTFPTLPTAEQEKYSVRIEAIEMQKEQVAESLVNEREELDESIQAIKREESEQQLRNSYIGKIGTFIEPITRYIGFTWKENIALLGGIAAKELTIATLGIVYSLGEIDEDDPVSLVEQIKNDATWTINTVWAFLFFILIYAPCISTLAIIKQETGSYKWAIFSLVFNTGLAYIVAGIFYYIL